MKLYKCRFSANETIFFSPHKIKLLITLGSCGFWDKYEINIIFLYNPDTGDIKTWLDKAESEARAIKSIDPERASGGAWGLLYEERQTQSLESRKIVLEDDAKISAILK